MAAPDQITESPSAGPDSAGMASGNGPPLQVSDDHTAHAPSPSWCTGGREGTQSRGSRRATAGRIFQRPAARPAALALWTCSDCGGAVTNPRHVRCDICIDADPAPAPEIRGRRGAAIAARKRAFAEWDKANPGAVYEPELFRREILPRLAAMKFTEIAEAAGCSKAYASDIRRGKRTPHMSTWKALGKLVGAEVLESATS